MSHRAAEEDGHLRCAGHEGQGSQVQGGGRGSPHLHFKQRGRRCNWEGNKEYVFSWGRRATASMKTNAMKQVCCVLLEEKVWAEAV